MNFIRNLCSKSYSRIQTEKQHKDKMSMEFNMDYIANKISTEHPLPIDEEHIEIHTFSLRNSFVVSTACAENPSIPTLVTSLLNCPIDVEMESATYDNTKPFIPEIRAGKVVRVYDGDTITIAARIHIDDIEIPKLFRYSVRLRRIDSPEKKTKNKKEKELAIKSRDALSDLIMGKMVILENIEYDKYGRILAEILTEDQINVSDWMLDGGFAVKYDGGTKHRPAEWTDVEV